MVSIHKNAAQGQSNNLHKNLIFKQLADVKLIAALFAASLLSACNSGNAPAETETTTAAAPAVETVSLLRTQVNTYGITAVSAELREMSPTLYANGTVVVLPEDRATVNAKIAGQVERFFIHEGQNVRAGQPLMSITSSAIFELQHRYLQAKADLVFLEKELERQRTLSSQNVGATKNYEEVQSRYFRAKADLQTASAQLKYLGIGLDGLQNPDQLDVTRSVTVTAPIDGNVSEVMVNLGASVGEQVPLCHIVRLSDMHAHVAVFAKDIGLVREGQTVSVQFPNTGLPAVQADVEHISKEMDPDQKTYALHVHLPAVKGNSFLPGMPVTAQIQTTEKRRTLAVPEAAVLHDGSEYYCFVALDSGGEKIDFQKVVFEPTVQSGGWVGLPEAQFQGKTVVVKGTNWVDGELRKGEMQE
jgi:cobalt-zinc-cadmium efflux system membrane fusion protein